MEKTDIQFHINGEPITFSGDPETRLIAVLRGRNLLSVKDGCSGQGACGACLVEMDGKPALACATAMKRVAGCRVLTLDGFPETVRKTLATAFVAHGAVQCGYCTPGMLTRAKLLLDAEPDPKREDVVKALKGHLCRCTGYVKIVDAVMAAAKALREHREISWTPERGIGHSAPKYDGVERALGTSPFIGDMTAEEVLHGALVFSEHPRARVTEVDFRTAEALPGVVRVFTAADIPGERVQGIIVRDWPMMVEVGESVRCIGDVIAGVVAETETAARNAAAAISVTYEVLPALTEVAEAAESPIRVHEQGNLLKALIIRHGESVEEVFACSAHVVEGRFETPFVDHAFLETEAALAEPAFGGGVRVYSQSQGIFSDREQIASVLNLEEEQVEVVQVATGGAFGGKEDLTVQHHAALYARILQRPVMVRLDRAESLRMHPKRHRALLHYRLACNEQGRLTGLQARIIGDTGAYASVGGEVVSRMGTHAAGAYHVPSVDVTAEAYYTNNPVAGAFRGFGVNQATFAMESLVDELCRVGGFDPWQFRYDNAITKGRMTTTGHVMEDEVGLRECLAAVFEAYKKAPYAGLACAIKNCGIGNGIEEISDVRIRILSGKTIEICHGWTEMGQGIHTVAGQMLAQELSLPPNVEIRIRCTTAEEAMGGVTTASRGTMLLGNAIIDAARKIKADLDGTDLAALAGNTYSGTCRVDWTTPEDAQGKIVSHFGYGFAVHMAVLDETGELKSVHAAHDAGKIVNPALFQGQIQGGVVMGLGYALSETFPLKDGRLTSTRMRRLGIPRIQDVPEIKVIGVECADAMGPHGAKGVGEIGTIPTAPAIANAFCRFDGRRRHRLPLTPVKKRRDNP